MFTKQVTQSRNRSKNFFKTARIGDINRDVLFVELLRERFQLRSRRNQNDLGLQSNDALRAGIHCVTDFCDTFCFGWIVAVVGVADQPIAGPDGVDNFS